MQIHGALHGDTGTEEDGDKVLLSFTDVLDGHVSDSPGAMLEKVNLGSMLVGITPEGTAREWIGQRPIC